MIGPIEPFTTTQSLAIRAIVAEALQAPPVLLFGVPDGPAADEARAKISASLAALQHDPGPIQVHAPMTVTPMVATAATFMEAFRALDDAQRKEVLEGLLGSPLATPPHADDLYRQMAKLQLVTGRTSPSVGLRSIGLDFEREQAALQDEQAYIERERAKYLEAQAAVTQATCEPFNPRDVYLPLAFLPAAGVLHELGIKCEPDPEMGVGMLEVNLPAGRRWRSREVDGGDRVEVTDWCNTLRMDVDLRPGHRRLLTYIGEAGSYRVHADVDCEPKSVAHEFPSTAGGGTDREFHAALDCDLLTAADIKAMPRLPESFAHKIPSLVALGCVVTESVYTQDDPSPYRVVTVPVGWSFERHARGVTLLDAAGAERVLLRHGVEGLDDVASIYPPADAPLF